MKQQSAGKIINIGSVLGRFSAPWNGAYSASKFALEGLSESLRYEMHGSGVFVSIIEPGLVDTNFRDNQIESRSLVNEGLSWENNHLKTVRRRGSNPDRVAHLVSKILRDRSPKLRYVVGWDAKVAIFLRSVLPSRIFEYFVCKFTNVL